MSNWKDLLPQRDRFYECEDGIIYKCDSTELIKEFPDDFFDTMLTDPPYNVSSGKEDIVHKGELIIRQDFGDWDKGWEDWFDYADWVESWFKDIVKKLKKSAWFGMFLSYQMPGYLATVMFPRYDIRFRSIFIMAKSSVCPSVRKINFISAYEPILIGSKGAGKVKNYLADIEMRNYMLVPGTGHKETTHPTEKPVQVLKHLLRVFTNPGDIVLDPFLGSGSTIVAAREMGRRWVGIEMNEEYCKMAQARVSWRIPLVIEEGGNGDKGEVLESLFNEEEDG